MSQAGTADSAQRTYAYLRTAMVLLLVAVGVAVIWQSWRQGWHVLSSVSAYYYTPAQGIFVGALVGLGACMIALRGVNPVEEVFLNLGGMCAAIVAVVPSSRDGDYKTALSGCQQAVGDVLGPAATTSADCTSLQALADATRANVDNNASTLAIVGLLGVVAAFFFAGRFGDTRGPALWLGGGVSLAVLLVGLYLVRTRIGWVVDNGHYLAAAGLLLSVVVVAVANAVAREQPDADRPDGDRPRLQMAMDGVRAGGRAVVTRHLYRVNVYAWLARLLLVVTAFALAALVLHFVELFWLEVAVAASFILFWLVQTVEQLPRAARRP